MSVFVWKPWLAVVVGVLIGGIAYLTTKEFTKKTKMMRSLYLPAVLWLIYAAWEFYARMQGANIRIDLLVIYPLLVAITTIGFVLWFIGIRRGRKH
jgi:drug/metabolite transporter (DMT)-like permease